MFFLSLVTVGISYNKTPITGALLYGAAGGNRTHDPLLTKEVRYHYATAAKGYSF